MDHLYFVSSINKDSTVNKTEYRSKRNPTGKPCSLLNLDLYVLGDDVLIS